VFQCIAKASASSLCPFRGRYEVRNYSNVVLDVKNSIMSSSYTTTDVFFNTCPMLMPLMCRAKKYISGFKAEVKINMHRGYPSEKDQ
jgi:hypothetical protein